jgi:lipopolysaccharide heptosyltransferase I
MNILIVRLGALGDIVHALPAAAALRAGIPGARIDWLVDAHHRALLELVSGLDRIIVLQGRSVGAWAEVVRQLRQVPYDVALDMQGLMKSAVLARASGAARVAGFSLWHLREKTARPFYSQVDDGVREGAGCSSGQHVIQKNLGLLRVIGIDSNHVVFRLANVDSPAARAVQATEAGAPFALLNPGAAWPNKRWPAERFGAVAGFLRDVRGIRSVVVWGPGDEELARAVVRASDGAAVAAPPTNVADLVALSRAATVCVSGDTGPLHLAGAAGTPVVGIFGPTDPERNGPWNPEDVVVSRYASCECHYERRCRAARWCLADVGVAEVTAAVQRRLGGTAEARLRRDV